MAEALGLLQFSEMFDRGFTHFLVCQHTPERMGRDYPTRDTHTEEQEADFIAGYNHAKRLHEIEAGREYEP